MDLITVCNRFPTQQDCISHLESLRWPEKTTCPLCGHEHVARQQDGNRVGRWKCYGCKSSFNVLSKTIFQGTKIPLQKWFVAIAILLNAKKSVSSCQLSRDLDLNQKSAWYMKMRIRDAMVEDSESFLTGIVEADEAFLATDGSRKQDDDDDKPRRGRGTKKLPVVGAVSRGGKVVAAPSPKVTAESLKAFLSKHINPEDAVLITDEFPAYNRMGDWIPHFTINHAVKYVEGLIHTNCIEGFWSLVKRALYGTHHHYSREHAAAYIVESCYKYNIRHQPNQFETFLRGAVTV